MLINMDFNNGSDKGELSVVFNGNYSHVNGSGAKSIDYVTSNMPEYCNNTGGTINFLKSMDIVLLIYQYNTSTYDSFTIKKNDTENIISSSYLRPSVDSYSFPTYLSVEAGDFLKLYRNTTDGSAEKVKFIVLSYVPSSQDWNLNIAEFASLIANNMRSGDTSTQQITAEVGKTYLITYVRNTSYDPPGIQSGADIIGQAILRDTHSSYNIYIGIVKATSTTIQEIGTNNPNWYCQLD